MSGPEQQGAKERLLWNVKKEVKQIMEEAVTRKFVHEDSSHIIALCGVVEACLLHMLKRRAAGFLRTDKIAALFTKVGKTYDVADEICRKVQDLLQQVDGRCELHLSPRGTGLKDDMEALPGYLSLHQSTDSLTLKWTPNQLMNGTLGDSELEKSVYWDYALIVPFSQIVCIHCHQQPERGGILVLVSQDGIQRPPLHFPPGGHLLAFLSCLENGLLPRGQLEPPLWSQQGKGKVFPKLRKRNSHNRSVDLEELPVVAAATDYVFRIIYPGHRHENITINYHHLAASRSTSVDDDEEEEDKLHAMLSMICSRNLTDPKRMKDVADAVEIQGFGTSLLPWQLEPCSQGSSCLSCSTSSSPYDLPSCCSCIHDRTPLKMLCESMKRQIVSRAFYGWLAYCRHLSTVRMHLSALVNHTIIPPDKPTDASGGLTKEGWSKYQKDKKNYKELELLRRVYYGGVQHEIRKDVWPFLLGHYKFGMTKKEMDRVDEEMTLQYAKVMAEWKACERIVKLREKESQTATKFSSGSSIDSHVQRLIHRDSTISNDVFMSVEEMDSVARELKPLAEPSLPGGSVDAPTVVAVLEQQPSVEFDSPDSGLPSSRNYSVTSGILSSIDDGAEEESGVDPQRPDTERAQKAKGLESEESLCSPLERKAPAEESISVCSAAYTIEMLDTVALNLHRIDKDVQRCDRNYWYFTAENLEKLRNIMCSYVWEHLDVGYVQGMCDLLAPLMVILDKDELAYSCFTHLMKRMSQNFPNGGAMDTHFANMRSLIQILDSELFELMHQNGDYTHFYFCYRWFLLDFKRELLYEDVFAVWEVIWSAKHISSEHFVLFIALALVELYREIIRDNNMDFTDIIKFFNEMAEHHNAQEILQIARDLVCRVQTLIENK
ncbi:small G protein signaling modulator 2 [Sphaerodactylus townsendi]|uniref:small G protein signaling modulator 2 n=1 Tax=Sphaerodactylus townsendi TaxID=933632 RepID=UPI00202675B5|nr:small G protein signaling modulator 2 [Sphaerodactylus townsendi]